MIPLRRAVSWSAKQVRYARQGGEACPHWCAHTSAYLAQPQHCLNAASASGRGSVLICQTAAQLQSESDPGFPGGTKAIWSRGQVAVAAVECGRHPLDGHARRRWLHGRHGGGEGLVGLKMKSPRFFSESNQIEDVACQIQSQQRSSSNQMSANDLESHILDLNKGVARNSETAVRSAVARPS